MRLLALAIGALALLAWLNLRDLLELLRRGQSAADPTRRSTPEQPDPADDVQPADPVTVHQVWPGNQWVPSGGNWWRETYPWVNTTSTPDIGDSLEPLTAADRSYLEATTLAIRRSTQSSEVTTEGMS